MTITTRAELDEALRRVLVEAIADEPVAEDPAAPEPVIATRPTSPECRCPYCINAALLAKAG